MNFSYENQVLRRKDLSFKVLCVLRAFFIPEDFEEKVYDARENLWTEEFSLRNSRQIIA